MHSAVVVLLTLIVIGSDPFDPRLLTRVKYGTNLK